MAIGAYDGYLLLADRMSTPGTGSSADWKEADDLAVSLSVRVDCMPLTGWQNAHALWGHIDTNEAFLVLWDTAGAFEIRTRDSSIGRVIKNTTATGLIAVDVRKQHRFDWIDTEVLVYSRSVTLDGAGYIVKDDTGVWTLEETVTGMADSKLYFQNGNGPFAFKTNTGFASVGGDLRLHECAVYVDGELQTWIVGGAMQQRPENFAGWAIQLNKVTGDNTFACINAATDAIRTSNTTGGMDDDPLDYTPAVVASGVTFANTLLELKTNCSEEILKGDIMVLGLMIDDEPTLTTVPLNWTLLAHVEHASSTEDLYIYYMEFDGGHLPTSSVWLGWAGAENAALAWAIVRGADPDALSTIIADQYAENEGLTSDPVAATVEFIEGALSLIFAAPTMSGALPLVPPAGYVTEVEGGFGTGIDSGANLGILSDEGVTGGASGALTVGVAAGAPDWITYHIVFTPQTDPGGEPAPVEGAGSALPWDYWKKKRAWRPYGA